MSATWGPYLEAESAYRNERLREAARPRRPWRRPRRPVPAPLWATIASGRRWPLQGSGAWHAAR